MDIKKHIVTVIIGLALSFTWGYLVNLGKEQKEIGTDIALLKVTNTNHNEKLKVLESNRDNLSNYYVTRIEFNKIVADQQKTSERIEGKLDKLIDKFYNK